MARSSLQRRRHAANRQEILDVAREIVSRDGPESMTLGSVAAQVGVTTPALYYYFDGKQSLLEELVETWLGTEADLLVDTCTGWEGREPGVLGGVVRAMYGHYRAQLPVFRLIYFQMGYGIDFLERLHPHSRRMFDAVQRVLEGGQVAGTVRPELAVRTAGVSAHAASVGLLTMISLAERAHDPLRQTDEALVSMVSDLLVSGARAK